ncbi:DJ-1/PfpI family protein [Halocella sp. SP3-1]|uniref:DJ-1/PfpI family protein n=1 Tax=Halocella sp. SP3-1 TaxID=2382161 RepID=UPI000F75C346|nr:DJ-1/PfpI family protein [Halocella sp. SP3-1]AZO95378.1 DJ-1/PfpI family protein [Halocella sp. SP3-1]
MKVLLFLANGAEMIELSAFIDVFGWDRHYNNGNINIVTCGFSKEIKSTFNIPIRVDLLIEEVKTDDYNALAIPGGFADYGFYEEAYNEKFLNLIREFKNQDKPIASICVGALPIGKSGILKGKRGTTYHLMGGRRQKQLEEFRVKVENEPVIVEDNIITSWCPSTAVEVAFKLLEMLRSRNDSDKIREIMGF